MLVPQMSPMSWMLIYMYMYMYMYMIMMLNMFILKIYFNKELNIKNSMNMYMNTSK